MCGWVRLGVNADTCPPVRLTSARELAAFSPNRVESPCPAMGHTWAVVKCRDLAARYFSTTKNQHHSAAKKDFCASIAKVRKVVVLSAGVLESFRLRTNEGAFTPQGPRIWLAVASMQRAARRRRDRPLAGLPTIQGHTCPFRGPHQAPDRGPK